MLLPMCESLETLGWAEAECVEITEAEYQQLVVEHQQMHHSLGGCL
jgi:hypothetical protein